MGKQTLDHLLEIDFNTSEEVLQVSWIISGGTYQINLIFGMQGGVGKQTLDHLVEIDFNTSEEVLQDS